MYDINLLPQKYVEEQSKGLGRIGILLIFMGTIVLISGSIYGYMYYFQQNYQEQKVDYDEKIEIYSIINEIKSEIKNRQDKIQIMSDVLEKEDSEAIKNTYVLDSVTGEMPEDVYFLNYSLTQDGNLTLTGKSKERESIAYFIYNLKESGKFTNIKLQGITRQGSKDGKTLEYNFGISLTVNNLE